MFARRRSKLRAREDRLTLVLATTAAAAGAAVFGGEVVRRYRRRIEVRHQGEEAASHHAEGPVEALQVAGQASQDTVIAAVAGYGATSQTETAMFNLFSGFVGATIFARVSTAGIRAGWWPLGNVSVGGRHIHHFVPGILLAFGSGAAAIVTERQSLETALAVPFGVGVGLTFDEAALLLDLRDVYWTPEGILSVQLTLGMASFLGAVIVGIRMLRRGEVRAEQQGLIPA